MIIKILEADGTGKFLPPKGLGTPPPPKKEDPNDNTQARLAASAAGRGKLDPVEIKRKADAEFEKADTRITPPPAGMSPDMTGVKPAVDPNTNVASPALMAQLQQFSAAPSGQTAQKTPEGVTIITPEITKGFTSGMQSAPAAYGIEFLNSIGWESFSVNLSGRFGKEFKEPTLLETVDTGEALGKIKNYVNIDNIKTLLIKLPQALSFQDGNPWLAAQDPTNPQAFPQKKEGGDDHNHPDYAAIMKNKDATHTLYGFLTAILRLLNAAVPAPYLVDGKRTYKEYQTELKNLWGPKAEKVKQTIIQQYPPAEMKDPPPLEVIKLFPQEDKNYMQNHVNVEGKLEASIIYDPKRKGWVWNPRTVDTVSNFKRTQLMGDLMNKLQNKDANLDAERMKIFKSIIDTLRIIKK